MVLIRLQKLIADKGICSRRKAEELILAGKVKVNGEFAKIGMKVDEYEDKIEVKGVEDQNLEDAPEEKIYIVLNKPAGFICSAVSEQGSSVLELITPENYYRLGGRDIKTRVYPVGRLDKDSTGLVLLTNDGELTNFLTHPRHEHEKEYKVTVDKHLNEEAIKILKQGMDIGEGEWVQGIQVKKVASFGRKMVVTIILKEGKNRQIRRMFGRLGYNIISLRRVRIGKLKLGSLAEGQWRFVNKSQII